MRKAKFKGEVVIEQVNDYECCLSGQVLGCFSNSAVVKFVPVFPFAQKYRKSSKKNYICTHITYISYTYIQ